MRIAVSAYRLLAFSGVENSFVATSNEDIVGIPYVYLSN